MAAELTTVHCTYHFALMGSNGQITAFTEELRINIQLAVDGIFKLKVQTCIFPVCLRHCLKADRAVGNRAAAVPACSRWLACLDQILPGQLPKVLLRQALQLRGSQLRPCIGGSMHRRRCCLTAGKPVMSL